MLSHAQPEIAQPKVKKQRLQLLEVEKEAKYEWKKKKGNMHNATALEVEKKAKYQLLKPVSPSPSPWGQNS